MIDFLICGMVKHFISYGSWLAAPREPRFFKGKRIIFREILGKTFISTLIEEDFIIDRSLYIALPKNESIPLKLILAILNSNLLAYIFRFRCNEFDNLFPKIRLSEFKELPIILADNILRSRIEKVVNTLLCNRKIKRG